MNSVKVESEDIWKYRWQFPPPSSSSSSPPPPQQQQQQQQHAKILYSDVINFKRCSTKLNRCCVLCGRPEDNELMIPKQNKGVCRTCDSSYWMLLKLGLIVKFCKGCKLFFSLRDFDGKPTTTKCGTCRRRGRDNYHGKKRHRHLQKASGAIDCNDHKENSHNVARGSDSDVTTEEEGDNDNADDKKARRKNGAKRIKLSGVLTNASLCRSMFYSDAPPVSLVKDTHNHPRSSVEDNVATILLDMGRTSGQQKFSTNPPPLPISAPAIEQGAGECGVEARHWPVHPSYTSPTLPPSSSSISRADDVAAATLLATL